MRDSQALRRSFITVCPVDAANGFGALTRFAVDPETTTLKDVAVRVHGDPLLAGKAVRVGMRLSPFAGGVVGPPINLFDPSVAFVPLSMIAPLLVFQQMQQRGEADGAEGQSSSTLRDGDELWLAIDGCATEAEAVAYAGDALLAERFRSAALERELALLHSRKCVCMGNAHAEPPVAAAVPMSLEAPHVTDATARARADTSLPVGRCVGGQWWDVASETNSGASDENIAAEGETTNANTDSLGDRVRALLAVHGGSAANALLAAFAQGQSDVAAFLMGDLDNGGDGGSDGSNADVIDDAARDCPSHPSGAGGNLRWGGDGESAEVLGGFTEAAAEGNSAPPQTSLGSGAGNWWDGQPSGTAADPLPVSASGGGQWWDAASEGGSSHVGSSAPREGATVRHNTKIPADPLQDRVRALLAVHGGSAANALLAAFAQGQSDVAAFLMGDLEDGDGDGDDSNAGAEESVEHEDACAVKLPAAKPALQWWDVDTEPERDSGVLEDRPPAVVTPSCGQ